MFLKNLSTKFPVYPKVTSSQEACDKMSPKMMDPALSGKLPHRSINSREPSHTWFPNFQFLLISWPGNLLAFGVAFHKMELTIVVMGTQVEPLSEVKLTFQRLWRTSMLSFLVNFLDFPPKLSRRQSPKFEVSGQPSCVRFKWARIGHRLLERCYSLLVLTVLS